jgi:UDP-GlcNAc3NAcA epimerase
MKIVTIIGARPQFIKAAVLSREFLKHRVEEVLVHTGQHFDHNMSEIFFSSLNLPFPKYNLGISSSTHGEMTGKMIYEIEKILILEKPDFVLVYGDTNSTLAGAIAASKINFQIIHVEAGLRSNNLQMPEEINRILTDRISSLLFCPTISSFQNLVREGFENFDCKFYNSGDIMFDSVRFFSDKLSFSEDIVQGIALKENGYIIATIHRQENTNLNSLNIIIKALNKINKSIPVILPIHPRTKKIISDTEIQIDFKVIDPIGYLEMLQLLKFCKAVVTDSGGLQKESFFCKKPCLVLRDETEWIELVKIRAVVLSSIIYDQILDKFYNLINADINFDHNFYGDGYAARFIVNEILRSGENG